MKKEIIRCPHFRAKEKRCTFFTRINQTALQHNYVCNVFNMESFIPCAYINKICMENRMYFRMLQKAGAFEVVQIEEAKHETESTSIRGRDRTSKKRRS